MNSAIAFLRFQVCISSFRTCGEFLRPARQSSGESQNVHGPSKIFFTQSGSEIQRGNGNPRAGDVHDSNITRQSSQSFP